MDPSFSARAVVPSAPNFPGGNPRYVHLIDSPRLGGGEKVAADILGFLQGRYPGHTGLLAPPGSEAGNIVLEQGIPVSAFRSDWLLGRPLGKSLAANASVLASLGTGRHVLLHMHSPFVYLALRPALAFARARTVLHVHLDFSVDLLKRALHRPPDLVIACGDFIRRRIEDAVGGAASRLRVVTVRNAVDTARFHPGDRKAARIRLGADPDRPLLVMVANLAPHKGQATAIRAVATLISVGLRPHLWLVGEERDAKGGHRAELERLVQELGAGDLVRFAGFRADVPELLRAADFLLLPSTAEGLPLVVLEAQASGAVVLAAPTAGIPEVVEDGRTGFLIPADDASGYAARLRALIQEPAACERIARAAEAHVRSDFTFAAYCDTMMAEYDRLMPHPGAV